MKYIKFIFILLLHFSLLQVTVAQSTSTDENGRENGSTATATTVDETNTNTDANVFNKKGHDFDDPNAVVNEDQEDVTMPNDLMELREEMSASGFVNNKEIQTRLLALEAELNELRTYNELLRLENRSIRRSLGSCCTEVKDGMTAADAYLLQNAPNPFNASADIEYFIPDGLETAKLEVRDIKGILLQSFDLTESGMGKVTFDSKENAKGTYLYSLVIDGVIIDSKVMMLTK